MVVRNGPMRRSITRTSETPFRNLGGEEKMLRVVTAAVVLFLIVPSTNGFAKPPIPLTDCETITQRGNYILENDLVFTSGMGNGSCLVIDSSHVNVDLNGQAITCIYSPELPIPCGEEFAPLAGIGIDIEADHVSIAGGNVDGFTVGIFGEADHISATGLSLTTGIGIVLDDASHSSFTDITYAGGDQQYHASNGPVLSVSGGGHNSFTTVSGSSGGGFFEMPGIIVENSSNNVIDGANIDCTAEAAAGPGILLTQDSDNNFVTNNNIFVLFGNGIEVDLNSDYNVIQNNTVETETTEPGFFAMLDQNPDCGSDVWTDNVFTNEFAFLTGQASASPVDCIH